MGLMNERARDQMGCAHPWPVLVDPHQRAQARAHFLVDEKARN